jgi:flagellar biosynthesis protein FliQ
MNNLKTFWYYPVKRISVAAFAVGFCIFLILAKYTIDETAHPFLSTIISLLISLCILIASIPYIFNELKVIWKDILSFINTSNRQALYEHYQKKKEGSYYKGPEWEEKNFQEILLKEDQVKAFATASIDYQLAEFEEWKRKNLDVNLSTTRQTIIRAFWVICAGILSILCLQFLGWLNYLSAENLKTLGETSRGFFTIPVALIGTIVAAPVIFTVWIFRDKNNRVQLENARKDTNLKDFQKISEWASGFHLPEIKRTGSNKFVLKGGVNDETSYEILNTVEDFIPPEHTNSISRRHGAESLQASAIIQLEAFMLGKYGEQFMEPAFLLIHAIWESIINQQTSKHNKSKSDSLKQTIKELHSEPVIAALDKAISGQRGNHLRLFAHKLEQLNLCGINNAYYPQPPINLGGVSLFKANLAFSNLTGSNLVQANLKLTNLEGASLRQANLQMASFYMAILRQTDFSDAKLQGTAFEGSMITECTVLNAQINRLTTFETQISSVGENQPREKLLSKGAIWDDDPEWLVGKIQDAALLEKIRQDCADSAKEKGA